MPNKVTGANSRYASQFESRGLRRRALVVESHGRYLGGAAVAQFQRQASPVSSQWRDALETKLSAVFGSGEDRSAARDLLAPLSKVAESERVAVTCLKLSDGNLARLERLVSGAITDYRDVLAWAEYSRQMRLGPSAAPADQARARREDMEEYARWLKNSQK